MTELQKQKMARFDEIRRQRRADDQADERLAKERGITYRPKMGFCERLVRWNPEKYGRETIDRAVAEISGKNTKI